MSPKNYILTKAKSLPIIECWIEADYKKLGITNVVVKRQEPGGKYTVGVYCIDLFCLGIKDAFCNCHLTEENFEKIFNVFSMPMLISPVYAHNLIYGALDYAEDIGFLPHKDFTFAENVLDPNLVDDGINDIEFGVNGIPTYYQGPNDNPKKIIAHLNKYLGEGNFDFIIEDELDY